MNRLLVIRYEVVRIVLARKYFYILLLVALTTHRQVVGLLTHGEFGTAPFSKLTFVRFLTNASPLLLTALALLCASLFSERELAVRKVLFSAPISSAGYFGFKSAAIVLAYLVAVALPILYGWAYFAWQFRFFDFASFFHPILLFLVAPSVLVFGLTMVAGRINGKLPYGILPLVFLGGVLNLGLPVWIDLCGNNFMLNYQKTLIWTRGTDEMVYFIPTDFLISRILFVLVGVILFGLSLRNVRG